MTPTRSEIEAARDRLREAAGPFEPDWAEPAKRLHALLTDTADLLDALLKEPDLTYVQRERDQAVMRWQIAEERVKRLEDALLPVAQRGEISAHIICAAKAALNDVR